MRGCISGVFRRVDNAAPEAVGVQGVGVAAVDDLVKVVLFHYLYKFSLLIGVKDTNYI